LKASQIEKAYNLRKMSLFGPIVLASPPSLLLYQLNKTPKLKARTTRKAKKFILYLQQPTIIASMRSTTKMDKEIKEDLNAGTK